MIDIEETDGLQIAFFVSHLEEIESEKREVCRRIKKNVDVLRVVDSVRDARRREEDSLDHRSDSVRHSVQPEGKKIDDERHNPLGDNDTIVEQMKKRRSASSSKSKKKNRIRWRRREAKDRCGWPDVWEGNAILLPFLHHSTNKDSLRDDVS